VICVIDPTPPVECAAELEDRLVQKIYAFAKEFYENPVNRKAFLAWKRSRKKAISKAP
jgi:hypothetical protein